MAAHLKIECPTCGEPFDYRLPKGLEFTAMPALAVRLGKCELALECPGEDHQPSEENWTFTSSVAWTIGQEPTNDEGEPEYFETWQ